MKNSMKFSVATLLGAATLASTVAPAQAFAYAPSTPVQASAIVTQYNTPTSTPTYTSYTPTYTAPATTFSHVAEQVPMAQYTTSGATIETASVMTPQTTENWVEHQVTDVEPSTSVANASAVSPEALNNAIVQTALSGQGGAYVWGGKTFGAWDCSGFVSWVFAQHGINLTSYTYAMKNELVPTSNPQPGDIVFTNGYAHVGIYLGNGQMISALNPAQGTLITSVDGGGYMPVDGYYTTR